MLIPSIGKDQIEQIRATKLSMERLEEELYIAKPHLILIISPHGSLFTDSFAVNAHTTFTSAFDQFGDMTTSKSWEGMPDIAAKIAHEGRKRHVTIRLVSTDRLDHGATVALWYLTNHLPQIKVLPLGYSALSNEKHHAFGQLIHDVISMSDKRVAIIASGDLGHAKHQSHRDDPHAPNAQFDETLVKLLEAGKYKDIQELDPKLIAAADECGYRSLLILLGALQDMDGRFVTYSYERPFGVGYLVGQFLF